MIRNIDESMIKKVYRWNIFLKNYKILIKVKKYLSFIQIMCNLKCKKLRNCINSTGFEAITTSKLNIWFLSLKSGVSDAVTTLKLWISYIFQINFVNYDVATINRLVFLNLRLNQDIRLFFKSINNKFSELIVHLFNLFVKFVFYIQLLFIAFACDYFNL